MNAESKSGEALGMKKAATSESAEKLGGRGASGGMKIENRESSLYLHNGVVVMKINKVIHLINIIKLSVCT